MLLNFLFLLACVRQITGLGEIIFALNAGGESFTDSHGIRYRRDYLSVGVASDYGKSLIIKRVPEQDRILYQTERYSTETFGYTIPMPSETADYVLWLKFSEVWFNAPNLKVFDVSINDVIVVKDLDIFDKVGRGVAHDEIIPFKVKSNKLIIEDKTIPFNNEIRVEFIKNDKDNPKINAIVVMKGTPDIVPKLEPYERQPASFDRFDEDDEEAVEKENLDEEEDDEFSNSQQKQEELLKRKMRMLQDQEEEEKETSKIRKKAASVNLGSEPNVDDPYSSDETSYLIPILVAIGAFIPLLFCLCKL